MKATQIEAARRIYSPAINPRTKAQIFPGLEPGSELGWGNLASGDQAPLYVRETFKYVVFADPDWDYKKRPVDFDKDLAHAAAMDHGTITANDPNLKDFFARGGKLIQYHGWSDPLIAPGHSVNYFSQVTAALGGASKVGDSLRLYMVPGMNHCRGGEGTDTFDMQSAIERWVEKRQAPDQSSRHGLWTAEYSVRGHYVPTHKLRNTMDPAVPTTQLVFLAGSPDVRRNHTVNVG